MPCIHKTLSGKTQHTAYIVNFDSYFGLKKLKRCILTKEIW